MSSTEPRKHSFLPSPSQLAMAFSEDQGRITGTALAGMRGQGRPKGARNKRTEKVARYFVNQYGDPIDIAGNIITTPIEVLTAMLRQADQGDRGEELDRIERLVDKLANHCSEKSAAQLYRQLMKYMSRKEIGAMEVAEWWRKIFQDAFTYVHGRQPTSIEIAERKDAVLIIPGINAPTDVSQTDLASAIDKYGLDAIDFAAMKLVDHSAQEAEFEEVTDDEEARDDDA